MASNAIAGKKRPDGLRKSAFQIGIGSLGCAHRGNCDASEYQKPCDGGNPHGNPARVAIILRSASLCRARTRRVTNVAYASRVLIGTTNSLDFPGLKPSPLGAGSTFVVRTAP